MTDTKIDLADVFSVLTDQELTQITSRARTEQDLAKTPGRVLLFRAIETAAQEALLGKG